MQSKMREPTSYENSYNKSFAPMARSASRDALDKIAPVEANNSQPRYSSDQLEKPIRSKCKNLLIDLAHNKLSNYGTHSLSSLPKQISDRDIYEKQSHRYNIISIKPI